MSSMPANSSRSATVSISRPPAELRASDSVAKAKPRRRTPSNSSTSSAKSVTSSKSEDQFVFSPHRSPPHDGSSFFPSTRGSSAPSATGQPIGENSSTSRKYQTTSRASPAPRSKPIAIELPDSAVSRKIKSGTTYTPIEPLSGRGDLTGGYFPFHEDPNKRITRPHPFHDATKEAKSHVDSFQNPSQDSTQPATSPTARRPSLAKTAMSEPHGLYPMAPAMRMPPSRGNTPVTSYVPSGLHQAPLPVGKYYPSNYEASRPSSSQSRTPRSSLRPPSSSSGGPSSIKSDTAVPQFNRSESSRGRSDSDAKRRLQQYQRDMVAQATQAARQLASGQASSLSLAAVHGVPVQKFQSGSHRPISPRLQPLGSPGPVTPMELEGQAEGGGYLTRGQAVSSPDAVRESRAVARAMKAEDERRRREGKCSPVIEAGVFGF